MKKASPCARIAKAMSNSYNHPISSVGDVTNSLSDDLETKVRSLDTVINLTFRGRYDLQTVACEYKRRLVSESALSPSLGKHDEELRRLLEL